MDLMRYKTKKYLKKAIFYTFNFLLICTAYTYAAHERYLPAFFEYYTGDFVRSHTQQYYELYAKKYLKTGNLAGAGLDMQNTVDYLLREPAYLYVKNVMDAVSVSSDKLPAQAKDDVISISTNPAFSEWLNEPQGQYAAVYQYETIRFIESFPFIQDYQITNTFGQVMQARGAKIEEKGSLDPDNEISYQKGILSIPVKFHSKNVGYFYARTEFSYDLDLNFANAGYNVSFLVLNSDGKVEKSEITDNGVRNLVSDETYAGPLKGIHNGYRFILQSYDHFNVLLIYKAASTYFYAFQALFYLVILAFLLVLLLLSRKLDFRSVPAFFRKRQQADWESLLIKSNELNREYTAAAIKFQSTIQNMRIQELERLHLISEHLTYLHQSTRSLEHEILE